MPKTLRKILIYFLAASFVFAGYWQIFPIEKAGALGPPPPTDPTLTFIFADTENKTIKVEMHNSAGQPPELFEFKPWVNNAKLSDFAEGSAPSPSTAVEIDLDNIYIYLMTFPPNQSCHPADVPATVENISSLYLAIWKPKGNYKYNQAGIYLYNVKENNKYTRIVNPDLGFWGICHTLDPISKTMVRLANDSYLNVAISWALTQNDHERLCHDMEQKWEDVKNGVRKLIHDAPSKNSTWWQSVSTYPDKSVNLEAFFAATTHIGITMQMAIGKWGSDYQAGSKFVLTRSGLQAADTIRLNAEDIQKDLAMLTSGSQGAWPCEAKMKKMQWEEEDEKLDIVYGTTAEFKNAIDGLATELNRYKDILSHQLPPEDTENTCGKMGYNLFGREMWNVLLCNLADVTHLVAGGLMGKAINWLEASIGIEAVKFEAPATDTTTTD